MKPDVTQSSLAALLASQLTAPRLNRLPKFLRNAHRQAGLCYLALIARRHRQAVLSHIGYFPDALALRLLAPLFHQQALACPLTFNGNGIAHVTPASTHCPAPVNWTAFPLVPHKLFVGAQAASTAT